MLTAAETPVMCRICFRAFRVLDMDVPEALHEPLGGGGEGGASPSEPVLQCNAMQLRKLEVTTTPGS